MNTKLYVWVSLLALALAYTQEGAVLVLKDEDLPTIKQTFPNLLIEYYVPWCEHCQKLAPIYQKLAERLIEEDSPVTIAKINCDEQQKGYEFGDVQQFPSLKYYSNGEIVQFDGDRTFNYLYKWITKRYKSPITKITPQQYQSLRNGDDEVKVVYLGSLQNSRGSQFTTLAYYDHYNQYYHVEEVEQGNEGNLEIIRSFDGNVREKVEEGQMQSWVRQYDRPLVLDLDQRSIFSVFVQKRNAVLFFIQSKQNQKKSILIQAAKQWRKNNTQLFIVVEEQHEDYFGLMEYLEMNPLNKAIVYINSQQSRKYIMSQAIAELTTQAITQFMGQVQQKNIPGLPLQNQQHHHHDHDHHHHDHDHDHYHHHHDHDHDYHHHHHDDDSDHSDQHHSQGEHGDCGCKHHKHNHKAHSESPMNQDGVSSNLEQNKQKTTNDLLGQKANIKVSDQAQNAQKFEL